MVLWHLLPTLLRRYLVVRLIDCEMNDMVFIQQNNHFRSFLYYPRGPPPQSPDSHCKKNSNASIYGECRIWPASRPPMTKRRTGVSGKTCQVIEGGSGILPFPFYSSGNCSFLCIKRCIRSMHRPHPWV